MPMRMSRMQTILAASRGSPSSATPTTTVPTAPMPIQIA
jgi:hypothetical protein